MSSESQILGVILSSLLHIVVGAALLWPRPMGIAPSSGQTAVAVELLPTMTATFFDEPAPIVPDTSVSPDRTDHRVAPPKTASKKRARSPYAGSADPVPVTAPAPGSANSVAGSPGDENLAFRATLLAHIEQFRRYPEDARQQAEQGIALVGFVMDRKGALIDVWLDRTSGYTQLDAEALDTLRRAQPLPQVPDSLPEPLQVVVPVAFALL